MSAVPRVGCGCFLLSRAHPGKVLMGRRKGSHGAGKLALPGGKLELDELIEECIKREIKEETNLDVDLDNIHQVFTSNDRRLDGDVNKHYITITCKAIVNIDSAPEVNLEPHKCEEWIWVSYDEVYEISQTTPERLFEPMINILKGGKVDPNFWSNEIEDILAKETEK